MISGIHWAFLFFSVTFLTIFSYQKHSYDSVVFEPNG